MSYSNYHPVYLALSGRLIVIVGGGSVAVEKLESLLPTGASISVVAPEVCDKILHWYADGQIAWHKRPFQDSDIDGAFMVIAGTDDADLNARIYDLGDAAGKLTNSVDDPDHCNFIMAAIARSGPMQVAVSSAGCSPALAQRVRNRIQSEILTDDLGNLAEYLGDRRAAVKAALPTYRARKTFWEKAIDSDLPKILATEGTAFADVYFEGLLRRSVIQWSEPASVESSKVYLIGAGPGDPGLLTLRAVEVLKQADVVVYDRLVNPIVLGYARPDAICLYAGKERGTPGQPRQDAIQAQLIRYALQGKTVVRLKGGDPFVFGRGGEEMLALAEAGVPFEVVPGISSSVAAPAAAHIPVTHRGVSTAFAVFAGHEADDRPGDRIPWQAAAAIPTAVFLMGVERLPLIVSRLIAEGRSADTPVAIVSNATMSNQAVVTGTLETIVEIAKGVEPPAVIVVGEVVRVREQLVPLLKQSGALETVAA
ncbi:MAG: siroheme synthase CysG [Fimbriimonas sp.]|nr:siroheme synthase CysG [Fimbriimonas sp.]